MPKTSREGGYTVTEVMIASAMLLAALTGFFATLASLQRTSAYEQGRTRALDDLRNTADIFAKDARHSLGVISESSTAVTFKTYVGQAGTVKTVTYQVKSNGGELDLQKLTQTSSGTATQLFVVKLTSNSIFTYDSATPLLVRTIGLHMESQPDTRYPPVVLGVEVSLRNVSA